MPIQQPDPTRGPRHHHAEAVVLDFMHPARTAGWAIGRGWQAGLDKAGPVGMRRHVKSKYLTPRERNKVGNRPQRTWLGGMGVKTRQQVYVTNACFAGILMGRLPAPMYYFNTKGLRQCPPPKEDLSRSFQRRSLNQCPERRRCWRCPINPLRSNLHAATVVPS